MAMYLIASATDGMTSTCSVKNTFIDVKEEPKSTERRNRSLPPSFKLSSCQVAPDTFSESGGWSKSTTVESTSGSIYSDEWTEVRTEASDDASYAASTSQGWNGGSETDIPFIPTCMADYMVTGNTCEPCAAYPMSDIAYEGTWNQAPYIEHKLSSKAAPFTPINPVTPQDVENQGFIRAMVDNATKALEGISSIKTVEAIEDANGWSLAIVPQAGNICEDQMFEHAKTALLQAAEQSNNVYVLGYCHPQTAFVRRSHGFECQLGIMTHSRWACRQYFSDGSCKYTNCRKDHAALQMPLQVHVELATFNAPANIIPHFKAEVAQLLMTVTAILLNTFGVTDADAFHEDQGCCVEIFVTDIAQKDKALCIAKEAVSELTQVSTSVFLLASASTPFFPKRQGCTFSLADMPDQTQACWDHYAYGFCHREQACRWQHPQCSVPVNIVVEVAKT